MPVNALRETLRADLKSAMLRRRREETALLRALIAAIDNAEAVPLAEGAKPADRAAFGAAETARRVLDAGELAAILAAEIASRSEAAAQMRAGGAQAAAERLEGEAAQIARYCA